MKNTNDAEVSGKSKDGYFWITVQRKNGYALMLKTMSDLATSEIVLYDMDKSKYKMLAELFTLISEELENS